MVFGQISRILLNLDKFSLIFRVWVKWVPPVVTCSHMCDSSQNMTAPGLGKMFLKTSAYIAFRLVTNHIIDVEVADCTCS